MKSKKVIILIATLLIVLLLSAGCTKKIEAKIGGKIAEKIIEKSTGGEVEIDTKDGLVVKMDGGSLQSGENLKWPIDNMGSLPKPEATIISIVEMQEEDATMIIFSFEKENGGADYMQKIVDLGYVQRMLTKSDDSVMYLGVKDDNSAIMFNYHPSDVTGSVTFMRNDDNAKKYFESEDTEVKAEEPLVIDMSESMNWPKDSMDNIPELKAQISSISLNNDYVSIGFKNIGLDDLLAYVEEIKALGFVLSPMESRMDNYFSYRASNNKDQTFNISWSDNEGNLTYTKR